MSDVEAVTWRSRRLRATPVSPVVRRIADEHHVDLSHVQGTGRRGRVTKKDIARVHRGGNGTARPRSRSHAAHRVAVQGGADAPADGDRLRRCSLMRQQIGEHMVRSLRTAAHCTTIVEADMSRDRGGAGQGVLPAVRGAGDDRRAARVSAAQRHAGGGPVHPARGGAPRDRRLARRRGADRAGRAQRARALARGACRADQGSGRAGARKRLEPDEVGGGTFTITNPGRYGALLATPIINQPQVAILDLEAVVKRPVVISDEQARDRSPSGP